MPCPQPHHRHKPWPTSGTHTLHIEACERTCGWCSSSFDAANKLRAHARNHVQNTETPLSRITIALCKAGRKKLSLRRKSLVDSDDLDDLDTHVEKIGEDDILPSIPESQDRPEKRESQLDRPIGTEDYPQAFRIIESIPENLGEKLGLLGSVEIPTGTRSHAERGAELKQIREVMFKISLHQEKMNYSFRFVEGMLSNQMLAYDSDEEALPRALPAQQDESTSSLDKANKECVSPPEELATEVFNLDSPRPLSMRSPTLPPPLHEGVRRSGPLPKTPVQDNTPRQRPGAPKLPFRELQTSSTRPYPWLSCCNFDLHYTTEILDHFEMHGHVPRIWYAWATDHDFFSEQAISFRIFNRMNPSRIQQIDKTWWELRKPFQRTLYRLGLSW